MVAKDETRREIEEREESSLPPWALRSGRASRARPLDPEGRLFDYRSEYQRDRDRILHSRSFRRLRQKTDGGTLTPIDQRRDRLTHTLEVAQLARTMARALALNEDLTEAIALGHDLGSPPFGAAGAEVLDHLLRQGRTPIDGGFHIPSHSIRVVDLIEKRYEHAGLNLTHDVREGIFKQGDAPGGRGSGGERAGRGRAGAILSGIDTRSLRPGLPASLEAQAVAAADRIATALGEMDDALRSGEIAPGELERLPLARELIRRVGGRYPARARGKLGMKANLLHRGLTHLLVTATIQHSKRTLGAWCRARAIEDPEAFLAHRGELAPCAVAPGARISRLLGGLREGVRAKIRAGVGAARALAGTRRILAALLEAYRRDPRLLDDYVLLRFKELAGRPFLRDLAADVMETEITRRYHGSGVLIRLVADHIAGMTDAYARFEYGRLSGLAPDTAGSTPRS